VKGKGLTERAELRFLCSIEDEHEGALIRAQGGSEAKGVLAHL
jgi:hypothetical protein